MAYSASMKIAGLKNYSPKSEEGKGKRKCGRLIFHFQGQASEAKDLSAEAKAKDLSAKAKAKAKSSRPRPRPRPWHSVLEEP